MLANMTFLTREEAAPRFEICGKCENNKGGICLVVNKEARELIYTPNSICPIDKWGPFDINRVGDGASGVFKLPCC